MEDASQAEMEEGPKDMQRETLIAAVLDVLSSTDDVSLPSGDESHQVHPPPRKSKGRGGRAQGRHQN
ncbi:hypothetical protein Dimus_008410 [Dionaea muscipula]